MKRKHVIFAVLFAICCITIYCLVRDSSDSVDAAYIVSDSTIAIFRIETKSWSMSLPYPHEVVEKYINEISINKKIANQAFMHGITKPGLNFSLYSSSGEGWHKDSVLYNAIYIEKNGIIIPISNLYVNYNGVTNYRLVNGNLYVKKLSPLEVDDWVKTNDTKRAMKRDRTFIY